MCQPKRIATFDKQEASCQEVSCSSTSSTVILVKITCHNDTRKIPQIVAHYNKGMEGGGVLWL